ncbi:MAG: dihydropteroate synthase [Ignavibacteria bacterium 13_1_40CM_2_61_4]|nr:MAG: dihydropteroate synthase [Ignavibacteria bacterium 13_1_40CM_2_61_4]
MANAVKTLYRFGAVEYDLTARTHLMGILNVTPDSFSDGGLFRDPDRAVRKGLEMVEEGADFIDVGGESTRPGSDRVSAEEEMRRVLPVIERLSKATDIPISVDTYKSAVAKRALEAGARIINDVSGLHFDPDLADVAAGGGATLVIMHMKGTPKSMQADPVYDDVIAEIAEYLAAAIRVAEAKGVGQIFIDPGIGFGKSPSHNVEIIRRLGELGPLGHPVLVGPSRKSFIGKILDLPVDERLEGTAAAVAASVMNGANVVRVHDVKQMLRVARVADAIVHS